MTFALGPFALSCPVGQGGMAEVWRGKHPASGRDVAVKILTNLRADDPRYLLAFGAEVRAVASLRHPHIVSVYDHGVLPDHPDLPRSLLPGLPWLAMEWVEGGTLKDRMGGVAWTATIPILRNLLGALAHAHARGVVHRDIKPSNILVSKDGSLRLSDFGIAHALDSEVTLDTPSKAIGTPSFMAPEQVNGDLRGIGPWTDLYSVGCLVYALLAGEKPFHGRTAIDIARAQILEPVLDPNKPLAVPANFRAILDRLLEKDPSRRYRAAAQVLDDLDAISEVPSPSRDRIPVGTNASQELTGAGLGLFGLREPQIGRASCRERVCQYV